MISVFQNTAWSLILLFSTTPTLIKDDSNSLLGSEELKIVQPQKSLSSITTTTEPTSLPAPISRRVTLEERPEILHKAQEAYEKGAYAEAVSLYQSLWESGLENGHVFYNLGNSWMRLGHLGEAIAAYLQATRLIPREGDVWANLAYARKSTKDAMSPIEPATLKKTLFFWHYALNTKELWFCLSLLNFFFWAGLFIRLRRRESEALRWVIVGLFVLLLAFGGSLAIKTVWPSHVAVVLEPKIKVHSGTSADTVLLFELQEGTEARFLDTEGDWSKIELSDGKRGWTKTSGIEIVHTH